MKLYHKTQNNNHKKKNTVEEVPLISGRVNRGVLGNIIMSDTLKRNSANAAEWNQNNMKYDKEDP